MTNQIDEYINQRYPYWLDYATYHAALAQLHDQGGDLLHTVLESLLKKDSEYLRGLLEKKKQGYTELDFFILRMIKLNAHSPTAPYRHKNKVLPRDANADPWGLDIIDEGPDESESGKDWFLRRVRQSREVLAGLKIPDREKEIFFWKFFGDNSLRSWSGDESYQVVCNTYNQVLDQMIGAVSPERLRIREFCKTFTKVKPTLQYHYKVQRLAYSLSRISCMQVA